ncbi:MAG: hypothetical protein HXY20_12085 [Acidobacteria bacterium]|nr:hypothetical protein [Acidobacteriota bacterium]
MNHRNFIIVSTVVLFLVVGIVAGLALYSGLTVNASIPDLPRAVRYLPADSHAVFGMNVQKFVKSPIFARFEEKHGEQIGKDLAEFTARTGVDPRKDIDYVVAAGKPGAERGGNGVVIAVGRFSTAAITNFINAHASPIRVDYKHATVYMIPEKEGSAVEKGLAFLTDSEIALGDLESLKAVLDVREDPAKGIGSNAALAPLLDALNPDEMFWFAGDPSTVLSRAPKNTPLGGGLNTIKQVYGTLNLTDAVSGKISVTATDKEAAGKLADIARGLVALGQLAGDRAPEIAELMKGIAVTQDLEKNTVLLSVNFPFELIERLEHARPPVELPDK